MGEYAYLRLGELEVDWGKNDYFVDYSALFQSSDLWREQIGNDEGEADEDEAEDIGDEDVELNEGYRKTLPRVLDRLKMLGCTPLRVRALLDEILADHVQACEEMGDPDYEPLAAITAEDVVRYFSAIDASSPEVRGKTLWDLIQQQVVDQFGGVKDYIIEGFIEDSISYLGGAAALVLLSSNAANSALSVTWDFGMIVIGGYANRESFVHDLDRRRLFLVATEGNTDALILRKAFGLRRPDVADFFYFINVNEGYPFTGTGNLFNFCKGLISIGVLNQTIIVYDNDAEGNSKFEASRPLGLPSNMRVMRLPDIEAGNMIHCIGPEGAVLADVNGRAASIECYLDLNLNNGREPMARWTNFLQSANAYQGALLDKGSYVKAFLNLEDPSTYDFTKVDHCLDAIIAQGVEIAQACSGTINPVRSYLGRAEFW